VRAAFGVIWTVCGLVQMLVGVEVGLGSQHLHAQVAGLVLTAIGALVTILGLHLALDGRARP
jgi:hypothetical protein